MEGEELDTATDVAATTEESQQPTAEEREYEAAVARGDIIEEPAEKPLNQEILADIAATSEELSPAQPEAEGSADEKRDDGTIPRARFNEVNEELKSLREKLAAMEAKDFSDDSPAVAQPQLSEVEILESKLDELHEKADSLLLEGEVEERRAVLKEIRKIDRQLAKAEVMAEVEQRSDQHRVQESMDEVAAKAYVAFPFLDIESDKCDMDAVNSVKTRRNELIAEGKPPAEALQKAVDEKGPKFARILGVAVPTRDTAKGDDIRAAREKEARERAANASLSQPAVLPSKAEKDSFAVDVDALTPAQIKALPEEEKARLRGDTL